MENPICIDTSAGEQVVEEDRNDKVDNTEVIKSLTEGSSLDDGKTDLKDKDKKSSKHSHKDKERDRDRKSRDYRSHRSSSRER